MPGLPRSYCRDKQQSHLLIEYLIGDGPIRRCGPARPGQGFGNKHAALGFQHWEDSVAIATINPATGETVKTFEEMSEEDVERCLAAAAAAFASYRLTSFAERAGWMRRAAGHPGRRAGPDRGDDDHRDGQDAGRGQAGGRQVRHGLPLLRRARRGVPGRRAGRRRRRSGPAGPTSPTSRSARCWPSCRGTSRSGRPCGSPPRR